jgi:hypothetical protein
VLASVWVLVLAEAQVLLLCFWSFYLPPLR